MSSGKSSNGPSGKSLLIKFGIVLGLALIIWPLQVIRNGDVRKMRDASEMESTQPADSTAQPQQNSGSTETTYETLFVSDGTRKYPANPTDEAELRRFYQDELLPKGTQKKWAEKGYVTSPPKLFFHDMEKKKWVPFEKAGIPTGTELMLKFFVRMPDKHVVVVTRLKGGAK